MPWGIDTGNLSEQLTTALTLVATIINVLLCFATKRTVKLHRQEVNHQITSGDSAAQHQIINTHRELFLSILNNPELLKQFAHANGLDPEAWALQKIAVFLINQVMINYLNFMNGTISTKHFEGFKRDAQDMFAYPLVRAHWQHVRTLHSEEFCHFVETDLLPEEPPQAETVTTDMTAENPAAQD